MFRTNGLWALVIATCIAAGSNSVTHGQSDRKPPGSLYDSRMSELRRSAVKWERRRGPVRKVINQVVLVPDTAAFLEAIAAWDEAHFFPILIDDAELSVKFVREFRPAKIVRFPGRPKSSEGRLLWNQAVVACGRAWTFEQPNPPEPSDESDPPRPSLASAPSLRREKGPRGDLVPSWLENTPPGVVVANSASPSLAGAVALAAGRFQPLMLWEPPVKKDTRLNEPEAQKLCAAFEAELAEVVKSYGLLGDDCDFLTLAAPYPEQFALGGGGFKSGFASFDDLLGRNRESLRRWAFVGRLSGDATESTYRAMCSLFLQPHSALMFDGYNEADPDFQPYGMKQAAIRLPHDLPSKVINGARADLNAWHRVLDPINEFGLVFVNTQGHPTDFLLSSPPYGLTADIPPTIPSIVIMNHSESAARPDDPETLAGAWLAGGAFIYFGALAEPYIAAFRTPTLVSSLITEGLPIAAVLRMGPDENPVFGTPWKLHLLGDPLFRVDLREAKSPRWPSFEVTDHWAAYADEPAPAASAPPATKLAWLVKATLLDAAKEPPIAPRAAVETALIALSRESLPANLRNVLDELRIDALPHSREHARELLEALAAVPAAEASARVRQVVISTRLAKFRKAIERADWSVALPLWNELDQSSAPKELKEQIITLAGALARRGNHLLSWRAALQGHLKGREDLPEARYLKDELGRLPGGANKTTAPSIRRGG